MCRDVSRRDQEIECLMAVECLLGYPGLHKEPSQNQVASEALMSSHVCRTAGTQLMQGWLGRVPVLQDVASGKLCSAHLSFSMDQLGGQAAPLVAKVEE